MSYLLSLKKTSVTSVKTMFQDLPRTDLHRQFAAWYYSLKLVKSLGPNYEDLHLRDPLRVINFAEKLKIEGDEMAELLSKTKVEVEKNENQVQGQNVQQKSKELEDDDGWDKWDDVDWENVQEKSEMSENERYQMFQEMFSNIDTRDSFAEVKVLLQSNFAFTDPKFLGLESHPILMLARKATRVVDKNSPNYDSQVLEELQDLLKDGVSEEVLLRNFQKMIEF